MGIKIFIGYEKNHPEAYTVCRASIQRFNDQYDIRPLIKEDLQRQAIYTRPYQGESTDFAFTRFLVPHLMDYDGYGLFCDGDFLWRCDPKEITEFVDQSCAVSVVKHPELIMSDHVKMEGKINRPYPKKYWSSLMYFNCSLCKELTREYVSRKQASELHGFDWAEDIGSIPATFNMLVGYYDFIDPKAVHFTDGGPWLEQYKDVPYADEWRDVLHWEAEHGQQVHFS